MVPAAGMLGHVTQRHERGARCFTGERAQCRSSDGVGEQNIALDPGSAALTADRSQGGYRAQAERVPPNDNGGCGDADLLGWHLDQDDRVLRTAGCGLVEQVDSAQNNPGASPCVTVHDWRPFSRRTPCWCRRC